MKAVLTLLGLVVLLVVGIHFWQWTLGAVALCWIASGFYRGGWQARREARARCDQQHAAILRGDDHLGVYGNYPPADL